LIVLKRWRDDVDLLVSTLHHRVRVVIMTLDLADRVPTAVTRLLDEFPGLLVVGIDLRREEARTFRKVVRIRAVPEFSVSGIVHAMFGPGPDHDRPSST
jgi:hypothetical protein